MAGEQPQRVMVAMGQPLPRLRVQGLGFRVQGSGFRVQGLGLPKRVIIGEQLPRMILPSPKP